MSKDKKNRFFEQDPDDKYIGNVFGWRVSIISLFVIIGFILLYFYLAKINTQFEAEIEYQDTLIQHNNLVDTTSIDSVEIQ